MNILFAAFWANATHKVKYINNEFSTHGLFIHRREIKTHVTHVYSFDKKKPLVTLKTYNIFIVIFQA